MHNILRRTVPLLALALVPFAGCLDGGDDRAAPADGGGSDLVATLEPHVVIGHIDTGINVYHLQFRDDSPRAFVHPSTYLPDYPEDAIALSLTFDHDAYWDNVKADCETVWSTIEPGRLYWFPGTKIVGGFYAEGLPGADCDADPPRVHGILDYGGHGTMVASRTASPDYGACPECLLVHMEGFSTSNIQWANENADWIDAQSNSWGPFVPVPGPEDESGAVGTFVNSPTFARTVEEGGQAHLSFWASGNGAATRGGVLGHPTLLDPRMTPSIVMVGGHDSGYVNVWPDWPPHVVSDSCDAWAAHDQSMDESEDTVAGGTSGATPYAAGSAGQILLEARRILGDVRTGVHDGIVAQGDAGLVPDGPLSDGQFTLEEWKRLLFVTASDRPEVQEEDGPPCLAGPYGPLPVLWSDVPEAYPEYMHLGYGATDDAAMERAKAVLMGEAPLPARDDVDAYFAMDAEVRQRYHDAYAG